MMAFYLKNHENNVVEYNGIHISTKQKVASLMLTLWILNDIVWIFRPMLFQSMSDTIILNDTLSHLPSWFVNFSLASSIINMIVLIISIAFYVRIKQNKNSECVKNGFFSPFWILIAFLFTITSLFEIVRICIVIGYSPEGWDTVAETYLNNEEIIYEHFVKFDLYQNILSFIFSVIYLSIAIPIYKFNVKACDVFIQGEAVELPNELEKEENIVCKKDDTMISCFKTLDF